MARSSPLAQEEVNKKGFVGKRKASGLREAAEKEITFAQRRFRLAPIAPQTARIGLFRKPTFSSSATEAKHRLLIPLAIGVYDTGLI